MKKPFLSVLLFVIALLSSAETRIGYETIAVEVREFDSVDLSPFYGNLTVSLPLQLLYDIRDCATHRYSDREIRALVRIESGLRIQKLGTEISALLKSRDEAFFAGETKKREESEEQILAKRKEIESMEETVAAEFAAGTSEASVSFGDAPIPKSEWILKKGENDAGNIIIISGKIEEYKGELLVDLFCSLGSETPIGEYHSVLDRKRLDESVGVMSDFLRGVVLGREWSSLAVAAVPGNAQIKIDSVMMGVGEVYSGILTPGEHVVTVSAPGFISQDLTVVLDRRSAKEIDVVLERAETSPVVLQSLPSNAEVYILSEPVGKTPLLYDFPGGLHAVSIVDDAYGFGLHSYSLQSGMPVFRYFDLTLPDPDPDLVALQRRQYYDSLGYLALSVPLTVTAFGRYSDLARIRAGLSESSPDLEAVTRQLFVQNLTLWGAVGLNIVLLIYSIGELNDYLRAMDLR